MGDNIGTLVMPTHQEVQMVSCTVCRKAKGRAKVEVSTASATTVESQVIRPSFVMQKVEKQKERRETAKVGMTVKVGQSERDGQKVKVGTHQVKVGSNKDQQERTIWSVDSKQYDVLVMETSTQEKKRERQ